MLFQPPFDDRELSPSSHEDTLWSHGEPYRPLETTQRLSQQSQRQVVGYRAPSYSSSEELDLELDTTTTTNARPATAGSMSSLSSSIPVINRYNHFGPYDDDDDEAEDEDNDFSAAIQQQEQEFQKQHQGQQQAQQAAQTSNMGFAEETEEQDDEQERGGERELSPFITLPLNSASFKGCNIVLDMETDDDEETKQTSTVPQTYTTPSPPLVHLEIQELGTSAGNSGHEHHRMSTSGSLPRPRQFIFEPNNRLWLGRAPSSSLDSKARLRQISNVESEAGQARPENGYDDGLFSNQVISKIHASIYEQDGQLVLEDKDSTHGSWVNDEPVSRRFLHDLDRVRLGRPVTRKDIHYMPLEFVVRIQSREHYEYPSARGLATADPVTDSTQQDILGNTTTNTNQSKRTEIELDEEFEDDTRSDLLACSQTQVEVLEIQEPNTGTPTEEQDSQEPGLEDDIAFEQLDDDYDGAIEDAPTAPEQQELEYDVDEVDDVDGVEDVDEVEDIDVDEEAEVFGQQENEYVDEEDDVYDQEDVEYRFEEDDKESLDSIMFSPDLAKVEELHFVREALKDTNDEQELPEAIVKTSSSTSTTTTTITFAAATTSTDDIEQTQGHLKRKRDEPETPPLQQQEVPTPKARKTVLFAAALAGVVVGSVGTVLTLANI
ncbi:hypothetical protein EC991_002438 [Linnemannia zychae]|nr:hypothetical protein EC991_002438 [Linnemannia zychae]